jgi:hypothetical protein
MIVDTARHMEALRLSGMLTNVSRRMYQPSAAMVRPQKVIRLLNEAGVKFVVMGTHGITGYRGEPRATQDVDVLISRKDHRKAIAAIREGYPKLSVQDTIAVTRFIDPTTGKSVIDLMKPYEPLYQQTFKNCVAVGQAYVIPSLEMALASKYAAMISPNRPAGRKHSDAWDFIEMVQNSHQDLDVNKLKKLAELVYKGGGAEILRYVDDAKAGRTFQV